MDNKKRYVAIWIQPLYADSTKFITDDFFTDTLGFEESDIKAIQNLKVGCTFSESTPLVVALWLLESSK